MPSPPPSDVSALPYPPASFSVDNVEPASKPVWTHTRAENLSSRYRREVVILPEAEKPVINPAGAFFKGGVSRVHPLIDSVHTAFAQHYPLTLSPDTIWLVIAQGFSHHITENSKRFRSRLVRHEERQVLTEEVAGVTVADMEKAIAGFSEQIREATDPVLHETLICDFTTTTPAIRTASEVVLMDAYSSYFEYVVKCICGIPRITVTGSVEDWMRIRARIEVIATYDLEWWVARLRPILDEFIRTIIGAPKLEFWQAIYKPRRTYGATCVTGWIADLFPYLNDAPNRLRNHIFGFKRENWSIPMGKGVETRRSPFDPEAHKGVSTTSFPSGLSSVPIKLTTSNQATRDLDLVAGYLAMEQSPVDLSISPVISWCITERPPATPVNIF